VILADGAIAGRSVVRCGTSPERSAVEAMDAALGRAGLAIERLDRTVGTGYGRARIPFAQAIESEIACHARGVLWKAPAARTVIDIGGQDAKAIRMNADGRVIQYSYNDKCASGTGRFLEVIAEALEVPLEELGDLAARSTERLTLSNQCVIFAETEIISLVNEGRETADIVNALHHAVARRAASLARGIGVEEAVVMSGGVARNRGMFAALGAALGCSLLEIEDPQINGALGAALIAMDALMGAVEG
jgi:predicted CoA-substrate-specific enzyme activase